MKTVIFIAISFISASSFAQSFHYDTVPNPNNNQRRLYKYEYPVYKRNDQKQQQSQISNQENKSGFDKSKLVFGGALGLSFSDNYTVVNIAPQIGYQFSQYLAAGVGVAYNYYSYSYYSEKWSYNYLGFNLYSRITPVKYIALQVQPEIYRMWASDLPQSRMVPCVLVGGGAILPVGAKGGISMMLYYDLIQDDFSPYRDQLVYSIGYVFNF